LKVNEFVSREVVDKLMKMANPVWQVILGLSRYPVFSPQNIPNTRKRILPPVMPCFRVFGVFRGSDLRNDGSYYLLVAEHDFARAAGAKKVME
jgi:hypothetical protein